MVAYFSCNLNAPVGVIEEYAGNTDLVQTQYNTIQYNIGLLIGLT